jgi:hypothetical protein
LTTDLNIDKIICKLEYGLIGFGVGYVSGTLIEYIESGKGININCFTKTLINNWTDDIVSIWKQLTILGFIIDKIHLLDYEYRSVIGKPTTFGCNSDQVKHQSLCYNKSEIPDDYSFSSADKFTRDCPSGIKDDGIACYYPPYGRSASYPWKFSDGFNLDDAMKRCEKDHPNLGCEKYSEIIYPKYRNGFHNFGCCLCENNKENRVPKDTKWITGHSVGNYCINPNYNKYHDAFCYLTGSSNDSWQYFSPDIY